MIELRNNTVEAPTCGTCGQLIPPHATDVAATTSLRRLSANFLVEEFAVSASHPRLVEPVPSHLIERVRLLATTVCQPIRDAIRQPIRITSGFRPRPLNAAVGGSATSQHLVGEAADLTFAGLGLLFQKLVSRSLGIPAGQVIYYPSRAFLHVALPSARYPTLSCHVHEPGVGEHYTTVSNATQLDATLRRIASRGAQRR